VLPGNDAAECLKKHLRVVVMTGRLHYSHRSQQPCDRAAEKEFQIFFYLPEAPLMTPQVHLFLCTAQVCLFLRTAH
jgi:hypothetical protein